MEVVDFRTLLKSDGDHHCRFAHLPVANGVSMSIQAGQYQYCAPRKDLDDVYAYTEFEIAFQDEKSNFLNPLSCLEEDFKHDDVMGYIPVKRVQEIYEKALVGEEGYPKVILSRDLLKRIGYSKE